jgi:trafficking protein particle complex subunit 5
VPSFVAPVIRSLEAAGYGIGVRCLELAAFKERPGKRETTIVGFLQFISGVFWQHLFGRVADALEKSKDQPNSYMIRDEDPFTNTFISVPKDASRFNPASFVAGIVRGALDSAGFVSSFNLLGNIKSKATFVQLFMQACTVQAVVVPADDRPRDATVYLIKFEDAVGARESFAAAT